jgi:hypothetical protein
MILIAWHAFQNQQAIICKEGVGFIVQEQILFYFKSSFENEEQQRLGFSYPRKHLSFNRRYLTALKKHCKGK